ncbi:MAG: carbohydrate ABC transporter permease [Clostridia bacterium]|nr:carbohydrate ABC transporter permease [Clostridia bacterium]
MKNNRIKSSIGSKIFDVFNVIIMIALVLCTFYPMLHILFASFSNGNLLLSHTGLLLKPVDFTISGYQMVFKDPMIVKGYANTTFVVVAGSIVSVLLTATGAYFLSRKNIMLQKPIMIYIIFTMFFSGGMIPFYFTVKDLGLYNSLWSLILPSAVNTYNLIIMRTGFSSIPDSLEESAKLDGAGHFTVLFRIVVPLAMPTIAVIILYYAVGYWNAWFNAMMFIQDRVKYPLQLVLRGILLSNDTTAMTSGVITVDQEAIGESIKYGVIVVATVPILVVYPFLQKYFVKGVMVGAVKG